MYLGMQLDRRLIFGAHVQSLIEKSGIAIRCLYPLINRRSHFHTASRIRLFTDYLSRLSEKFVLLCRHNVNDDIVELVDLI